MNTLNRSPGYYISTDSGPMQWPDIDMCPHLQGLTEHKYKSNVLDDLSHLLDNLSAPNIVKRELSNIKAKLKFTNAYSNSFFTRFHVEYQKEFDVRQKQNLKPLDAGDLAYAGYEIFDLDLSKIKSRLKRDIDELLAEKPIKNYRKYDRHKVFKRGSDVCNLLQSLYTKEGLCKRASDYFGFDLNVFSCVLHISQSDDIHYKQVMSDVKYVPKTVNLHYDPKSGTIKSIVYLKDIDVTNGPFSYIPESHIVDNPSIDRLSGKATSTTNYLDTELGRWTFMNMPERMRKTSLFGSLVDDTTELSQTLLSREVPFLSSYGNVIMFDPAIHHRGGMPQGDHKRISLQIALRQ